MLKDHLELCLQGVTLTEEQAESVMHDIMNGLATPSQIASFVTIMRFRGETVDEITGFAKAMRQHSMKIPYENEALLDTCGTAQQPICVVSVSYKFLQHC